MTVHAEFMGHPTMWISNKDHTRAIDLCKKAGDAAKNGSDALVCSLLACAVWLLDRNEETGYWVYEDTGTRAGYGFEHRPCRRCGQKIPGSDYGKADPCLGRLPGVDNACCGHGDPAAAYIRFTNGVTVRGFTWIDRYMVGRKVD